MEITIIKGKQGTGKSRKALELSGLKNTLIVYSTDGLKEADEETQAIIFEEWVFRDTLSTHNLFVADTIEVRPVYSRQKMRISPKLIFVTQSDIPYWVVKNYNPEVIEL